MVADGSLDVKLLLSLQFYKISIKTYDQLPRYLFLGHCNYGGY